MFNVMLDKEQKRYEQYLNKEIVIAGDTLTTVDYSIITQTFTLSNGTKVSDELIFNP